MDTLSRFDILKPIYTMVYVHACVRWGPPRKTDNSIVFPRSHRLTFPLALCHFSFVYRLYHPHPRVSLSLFIPLKMSFTFSFSLLLFPLNQMVRATNDQPTVKLTKFTLYRSGLKALREWFYTNIHTQVANERASWRVGAGPMHCCWAHKRVEKKW